MRIAVFGSWRLTQGAWPSRGSEEEFDEAAFELGRQFAHAGQTAIVGGTSPRTADVHIVNGYLSVAAGNANAKGRIQVVRPKDDEHPFERQAKAAPHLFEYFSRSQGWWEGAHLISVRQADAVLAIGGGKGTFLAGLAATVASKPLVPVGSFGGASEELLRVVLEDAPDDRASALRALGGPWTQHTRDVALGLLGVTSGPRVLLVHGRSNDWLDLKDWLEHEARVKNVVVMGQQFGAGRTLPEKFESLAASADAAIALATPDDVGGLASGAGTVGRARQNVWIEVGWFWGRLGRGRLMMLTKDGVEIPSDLQGIETYQYRDRPRELADSLRSFLRERA